MTNTIKCNHPDIPECDHTAEDDCCCVVEIGAGDAPDVWESGWPPGGYVCLVCGTPTESEPCQEHQPAAYGRIT